MSGRWLALTLAVTALGCLPPWAKAPPRVLELDGQVVARSWQGEPFVVLGADGGETRSWLSDTTEARAVAAGEGIVYAAAGHRVWAVRAEDGTVLWRTVSDEAPYHTLLAMDDERLFLLRAAAGGREWLVSLSRDDGEELWAKPLDSHERWRTPSRGPSVAAGLVVVPTERAISAFGRQDGTIAWHAEVDAEPSWLSAGGKLVYAVVGTSIVALGLEDGTPRWRFPIGRRSGDDVWPMTAPLRAEGDRLIARRGGRLVAVDATTAQLLWTGPRVRGAVLGRHHAFAQLGDERYGLVDLTDGSVSWTVRLDDDVRTPPTFLENRGLVLLRPGEQELRAYDLARGKRRWRIEL